MTKNYNKKKENLDMSFKFHDYLSDADAIEQRPLSGVAKWTLYSLVAMLMAFLLWACISEVDKIVVAHGKLIPSQANMMVQPLETSIVKSIDVQIGQVVKKGQQLAALDPTFAEADESQLRGRHSSLQAHVSRLESELGGKFIQHNSVASDTSLQFAIQSEKRGNYEAQITQHKETLARLKQSLETNQKDQTVLASRVKSLKEIESMQDQLALKNFGNKQKLLEAQEHRLEVERDLDMSRNRESEIKREISAEEAGIRAFQREWKQKTMEELANVRRERDSLNDQLLKAEKRRSLVTLTAPFDAVVLDMAKRSVGSIIREAEPFFTLVALNTPLEAEVEVDAADIGLLKVGDNARIKLEAFPFQKYGTLEAKVTVISEDVFSREPSQARLPGQTDAYYQARLKLESTKLKRGNEKFRLMPGMAVTSEIIVGRRTVISYFLYPLISALDQSMREP